MPGNTILINNFLEYYVGDSRMKELLKLLDDIGLKLDDIGLKEGADTVPVITTDLCKKCDKLRILSIDERSVT